MKSNPIKLVFIFILIISACTKNDSNPEDEIKFSIVSAEFTGCTVSMKSTISNDPSLVLTALSDGYLLLKAINTEFCCATDSISIIDSIASNNISIEIVDNGPFSWCYCPHTVEMRIGPLKNENYALRFLESENAYKRDTFDIEFTYSQNLDTTYISKNTPLLISEKPLTFEGSKIKDCEKNISSEKQKYSVKKDTLIISDLAGTLNIFAGINQSCCASFTSDWSVLGDTLFMQINNSEPEVCNCICYYTFDFSFSDYEGQGFFYKLFVDDLLIFKGDYNLNP